MIAVKYSQSLDVLIKTILSLLLLLLLLLLLI